MKPLYYSKIIYLLTISLASIFNQKYVYSIEANVELNNILNDIMDGIKVIREIRN